MSDQFQDWRERLNGNDVPIVTDTPQSGYYKMKDKLGQKWLPVAIWNTDDGAQICRVGSDTMNPLDAWHWCAKHPIKKEIAKQVFDTGQWPDMPDDLPLSNMPSDPYEALLAEIEDKIDQAQMLVEKFPDGAKTKVDADLARNMEAQIQALLKRADEMHKSEKAPHLEASRAVDQRFAFRKGGDQTKRDLKAIWGKFAAAEEKRLRKEAEAKAAEERKRVEAERKRIEDEQAKLMAEDPIAALTSEPEPLPELPAVEPVKVNVGGGVGSRGGLTTVWRATIEDYRKAALHYIETPDIRDAIDKLVSSDARTLKERAKADGVKFYSERVAK